MNSFNGEVSQIIVFLITTVVLFYIILNILYGFYSFIKNTRPIKIRNIINGLVLSVLFTWCVYLIIKFITCIYTGNSIFSSNNDIFIIINIVLLLIALLGVFIFNIYKIIVTYRRSQNQQTNRIDDILMMIFLAFTNILIVFIGIYWTGLISFVIILRLANSRFWNLIPI